MVASAITPAPRRLGGQAFAEEHPRRAGRVAGDAAELLPAVARIKFRQPVLDPEEARALLDSIDVTTPAGLRDRALIGLMVYSASRASARRSA